MDDTELRLRCLELAQKVVPTEHDAKPLVEIATALYAFTQGPMDTPVSVKPADKPTKGKKATADLLS